MVLYDLGMGFYFLAMSPYFLYKALFQGKYIGRIRQGLGHLPEELRGNGSPTLWFHSCSLGETLAVQPLALGINKRFPSLRLVFSTITNTGQYIARKRFSKFGGVFYFPFDFSFSVRRALEHVKPHMVVVLETEIWPNFVLECKRKGVKVLWANGRMSEKAHKRYMKVKGFLRPVLEMVDFFVMKSEEDAERFISVGAPPDRVAVSGNIKYDRDIVEKGILDEIAKRLDAVFHFSAEPMLIVVGSTGPGEEEVILEAFLRVKAQPGMEMARLVLAPRHPERFDEVARLIERYGIPYARRSTCQEGNIGADVFLLDSIGELAALYRFARVVFVGGTIGDYGGHSVIEPAVFRRPITVGPHMENWGEVVEDFGKAEAMIQIGNGSREEIVKELGDVWFKLLRDKGLCEELGTRAEEVVNRNRGAIRATLEQIERVLSA